MVPTFTCGFVRENFSFAIEAPLDIVKRTGCWFYPDSFVSEKPTTGVEPVNLILTKDVLYQLSYMGDKFQERAMRLELTTATLEGWSSTN